jgi:hypothetical protein
MKKAALSQLKLYVGITPLFIFALALIFQACGGDDDVPCGDLQATNNPGPCAARAVDLGCGPGLQFEFDAEVEAPAPNCTLTDCSICEAEENCINGRVQLRTNNVTQCSNAAQARICGPYATWDPSTGICTLGPCQVCRCTDVTSANDQAQCNRLATGFQCFQPTPTVGPEPPPFETPRAQFSFDPETGSCHLGPTPPPSIPNNGCAKCELAEDVF